MTNGIWVSKSFIGAIVLNIISRVKTIFENIPFIGEPTYHILSTISIRRITPIQNLVLIIYYLTFVITKVFAADGNSYGYG